VSQYVGVGLAAGALTTGAWLPQIYRTWRVRSARDISWAYLLTFGLGVSTWAAYGVLGRDIALILWNAVSLAFVVGLLVIKRRAERVDLASKSDGNSAGSPTNSG
jgi:MtN3 and saliva related transmembrane protein